MKGLSKGIAKSALLPSPLNFFRMIIRPWMLRETDWIMAGIVSPNNSSHDYVRKLNLYMDAGASEYWIVNPAVQSVYVYFLREN